MNLFFVSIGAFLLVFSCALIANTKKEQEYDTDLMDLLEIVWGRGYMSFGKEAWVDAQLGDFQLAGKVVLDIGAGLGGPACHMARRGAHVIAMDVEKGVLQRMKERIKEAGLEKKIQPCLYDTKTFPVPDASIDLVFVKGSVEHVRDKKTYFREIYRVLKPGASLTICGWMLPQEAFSPEAKAFFESETLDLDIRSASAIEELMQSQGFEEIQTQDWTEETISEVEKDLEAIKGPLKHELITRFGDISYNETASYWQRLLKVHTNGHLLNTIFRAKKPDESSSPSVSV